MILGRMKQCKIFDYRMNIYRWSSSWCIMRKVMMHWIAMIVYLGEGGLCTSTEAL